MWFRFLVWISWDLIIWGPEAPETSSFVCLSSVYWALSIKYNAQAKIQWDTAFDLKVIYDLIKTDMYM